MCTARMCRTVEGLGNVFAHNSDICPHERSSRGRWLGNTKTYLVCFIKVTAYIHPLMLLGWPLTLHYIIIRPVFVSIILTTFHAIMTQVESSVSKAMKHSVIWPPGIKVCRSAGMWCASVVSLTGPTSVTNCQKIKVKSSCFIQSAAHAKLLQQILIF